MIGQVQTTTEVIYAGRFSVETLWVAGVCAAILVGILTWREARSTRRWLVLPLWVLRVAAVIAVLWMLAEKTMRTEVRRTRTRAVSVVVDTSASMSVSDEPADEDIDACDLRWAAVQVPAMRDLLGRIDGAAARLALSRQEIVNLTDSSRDENRHTDAVGVIDRVLQGLDEVDCELCDVIGRDATDVGTVRGELAAIRNIVVGEMAEKCRGLRRLLNEDWQANDQIVAGETGHLLQLLADVGDRFTQLAETLADRFVKGGSRVAMDRVRDWGGRSRSDRVAAWLADAQDSWLTGVQQKARLLCYRFDSSMAPVPVASLGSTVEAGDDPAMMSTDMTAAIRQAVQDGASHNVQAVVLVTDGRHNVASDPLKIASATSCPRMFVVPIGQSEPMRDVVLHHAKAPRAVFKNDLIVFEAMLDAYGFRGQSLDVQLLADGQVIESREVVPDSDHHVGRLSFTHKAETLGRHTCRLQVAYTEGERVRDNNEAQLDVDVIESSLSVLLVDRLPRWEYRFLRNLLKRDERVEFKSILLDGPANGGGVRALPDVFETLHHYRVVVLGDVAPDEMTERYQDALAAYVREGGTLVVIAGREYMPAGFGTQSLAKLLPVEPSDTPLPGPKGYGVVVTAEGRDTPVTRLDDDTRESDRIWREQIVFHDVSEVARPKPTAHVLMRCVDRIAAASTQMSPAFLCWQFYGRGRVVYLSAPVSYQLRQRFGDWYHNRFWGQLLRWAIAREMAVGSKTVQLATDKTSYQQAEPVHVRARLKDLEGQPLAGANVTAAVYQGDTRLANVTLVEDEAERGLYNGVVSELPVGPAAVRVEGQAVDDLLEGEGIQQRVETAVRIEPEVARELRDTCCDLAMVSRIAEATGGLVVPPTAVETVLSQLDLEPEVSTTVTLEPVWNQWWVLWLVVACLSVEWLVRKLGGLA